MGPATGRALAGWIASGDPDPDVAPLGLGRFSPTT